MSLGPAEILKLWNRVGDRFGFEKEDKGDKAKKKKETEKEKQAAKVEHLITKALTRLRTAAQGNLKDPATAAKFGKTRDKTVLPMKKYCVLLRGTDLKDAVQDLTKLRTAVKQLTVVVEGLGNGPFEESGAEVFLYTLNTVDTKALDQAMEDPKFGEYSDAELEMDEDENEGEEGTAEGTVSPAAAFADRLKELLTQGVLLAKTNPGAAAELKLLFSQARTSGRKDDFIQANGLLDKAEELLKQAMAPGGKPTGDGAGDDLAATLQSWQAARGEVLAQLAQLQAAIAKSDHPNAGKALILIKGIPPRIMANPTTIQAVTTMEAYLQSNPIIAAAEEPNVFGVPVQITKPLLKELATMKTRLKS
jgi:hypothetical protein